MTDIKELKEMIIDLRLQLVMQSIPKGHCPYAYYRLDESDQKPCDDDCDGCKRNFKQKMQEQIRKEVELL